MYLKRIIKKYLHISPSNMIKTEGIIFAGKQSYHNANFCVQGSQNIYIGSYCTFAANVRIITDNHDYNYVCMQNTFYNNFFKSKHPGEINFPPTRERTKGPVIIGNDVWIGHDVTILSGVTIGDGSILANKSVITKDVEPYSIVTGIPARKVKNRFSKEKVDFLLKIRWWDWKEEKILKNKIFFTANLNSISVDEIKEMIV